MTDVGKLFLDSVVGCYILTAYSLAL